jgi:hypothetical protein
MSWAVKFAPELGKNEVLDKSGWEIYDTHAITH